MITDRSDKVHETWRQSSERFDYFVLAVTGALCAYISQTLVLRPLAFSPNSSEFLALVLLCASVVAGFRRIEAAVTVYRTNHLYLRALEEQRGLAGMLFGSNHDPSKAITFAVKRGTFVEDEYFRVCIAVMNEMPYLPEQPGKK